MKGNLISGLLAQAQLDASLCTPQDNPMGVNLDPTRVDVKITGSPELSLAALNLLLPQLDLSKLTIKVTPPNVTLKANKDFAGLLGIITGNLSPEAALQVVNDTIAAAGNGVSLLVLEPLKQNVDNILGLFPTGAPDPLGVIAALRALKTELDTRINELLHNNAPADNMQPMLAVESTPMLIEIEPLTAKLGSITIAGDASAAPLTLAFKPNELSIGTAFAGLAAALKGCLVLNGGSGNKTTSKYPIAGGLGGLGGMIQPQTAPSPVITHIAKSPKPHELEIHGQHFGEQESGSRVVIKTVDNKLLAAKVLHWEAHSIRIAHDPVTGNEQYIAQVVTAGEQWSNAYPVAIGDSVEGRKA